MKLTQTHIRQAVGPAAYQRGLAYFEQGRVHELEVESDDRGYVLYAGTVGSAGAYYEQEVQVAVSDDDLDIDGSCTCPVSYNCKHVAAVCCAWAAVPANGGRGTVNGDAMLTRWLESLARAGSECGAPAAADESVIYLLGVAPAHRNTQREELAVEARVVKRRGKDGKPTRGRALDLHDLQAGHGGIARAATATDRDIAGLLIAGSDYWMRPTVRGRAGHHALRALVDSGRCYWEDAANPPLAHGAERALILRWQRQGRRAVLELDVQVEGGGMVVPCAPPLYLDPLTHMVGPLATQGLNHEQLLLLESAPAVPVERAASIAGALATHFPTLPLPPPAEVELRENAGASPVPCVRLQGARTPHGVEPCLALDFRYAVDRIHAWPLAAITLMDTGRDLVRVQRDVNAEQAAHARIAALGFTPAEHAYAREPATRAFYVSAGEREIERVSRWSHFVRQARADLEAAGWEIEIDAGFPLHFERGDWFAEIADDAGGHDWFALGFRLQVGDAQLPLIELLLPILDVDWTRLPETVSVPLGGGRYVDVPAARMRPLLDVLQGVFSRLSPDGDATLRLSRMDAALLGELEAQGVALRGGQHWRELAARLRDFDGIRAVMPDPDLAAVLRPYQQRGLDWLQFLREYGFNGILADDMGLGKTVQTLAHVLAEKRAGRLTQPVLVVAPTSLMGNWRREAERFAPTLAVEVLHGQARHSRFDTAATADLLLTTYPLLPRDAERLREFDFHSVILDEAQTIKNPRAKAAQVVRSLAARHRLCLTGTPLENHLGELWALFDFLMPGFLGDAEGFRRLYRTPIEVHGDAERQAALARRIAPFMLRRTKQAVAGELPPKTEIVQRIELGTAQAELYESIRVTVDARVREAIARQGLARSHITVLDALLKLRQVCCDPRLLKLEGRTRMQPSAKLEVLLALLDELLAEGRKVLVFSQFTSMLALIEEALNAREIAYTKLTGQTKHRDAAIERFRGGEVDLFLISLKAGGVGLNLAEADTVIHYDPWWNPAVEAQATDRAHRIGQTQPVFVYKLIVENSVEEKMLELQARKRALAAGVYAGQEGEDGPPIDAETLTRLFEPLG